MEIYIKGARVHNLKNIELRIPHNKLVVITGLSGSGKSTLAFDTIFAEGQRRYVESLSAYARQFLGRIEKPDVDIITGIAPAIAVEQKVNTRNPRSTVGTSTEIYEYLRLLFARIGHTFSPVSGTEVKAHSTDDVVAFAMTLVEGSRVMVVAPLVLAQGQGVIEKLTLLLRDGYQRILVDGVLSEIEDAIASVEGKQIDILIDRLVIEEGAEARLFDSAQKAFNLGEGVCEIIDVLNNEKRSFSNRFELDGITFERPFEHLFSFNNPLGACPVCEGYGKVVGIDEELVIPDKSKSLYDDAIVAWRGETMREWKQAMLGGALVSGLPIHTPYYELTREQKLLLWTGNDHFEGLNQFFKYLDSERYKIQYRVMLSRYTGKSVCSECNGGRLRKEATWVKIGGRTIVELARMPIDDLQRFFAELKLDDYDKNLSGRIFKEITNRLQYLSDVGLGYLTLDRQSSTLSGGESQRINLATSLGSSLVGSLYILDEPSIGLHPRDTERLIKVLKQLRDLGNTVIVVEHEEEVIRAADLLIDIGPEAGIYGGEVVFNGTIAELPSVADKSLTAQYLLGMRKIELPTRTRKSLSKITIKGARQNNLKNIDVSIPLGVITCITGVSGSGKSSLVGDILYPALHRHLMESGSRPGDFDSLGGDLHKIKYVELVDQNPIGKSLRSNPVTYIKAYDDIRRLYSDLKPARQRGYDPSSFSFNIAGGRCEECKGEGIIRVSMQFMADVEMVCEQCNGHRFKEEILEIKYRDKTIFDVLEMSVDEAVEFFGTEKERINNRIVEKLKVLQDVGLGYVKLGQSSSTLSGGESQRVKLATFLLRENSSEHILFIFDEPTTGLHFHDINKLLKSFNALVSKGHTIVIVEHNVDVIKCADWVIDLGADGGEQGGHLVFEGTPRDLLKCKASYTAKYLKEKMK
ncbi:Excinuclease ABC subunit A [Mucinivorans hirudinis]|uniref:UvrABC system protein A n=1 Tax=Mucinivorans hirudinis TaxID=1433126 RepID=A0A060R5M9_9BACT|nr:Excinuclease ABC subunit A [Mucinivorans hirudinis]